MSAFFSGSRYRWSVLAAVIGALAAGALALTDFGERWELRTHDLRFRVRGPRASHSKIVIAAIGQTTVDRWEPEPLSFWGAHFADAIRNARRLGATAIGLDVIPTAMADEYLDGLGIHNAPGPNEDLALAVEAPGAPAFLADTRNHLLTPALRQLRTLQKRIGFVDVPEEADSTVRSAFRRIDGILSFDSLLTAAVSNRGVSGPDRFWINFTQAESKVLPLESLAEFDGLSPARQHEAAAAVKNAVVLIGDTLPGSQDKHQTPNGRYLPGVFIHADILSTLLDNRPLKRMDRTREALASVILGLLLSLVFSRVSPRGSFLIASVVAVAVAGIGLYVFNQWDTLLPVVGPLAAVTLTWTLGQSVRTASERLHVERVFGRYISPEVRDYLLRNPDRLALGGERRDATILFLDLRNYTAHSQHQDPSAIMAELNRLFSVIVPPISRQNGLVLSYTGDGVFAVFGAPYPLKQRHAQAAVDAAEQILRDLYMANRDRPIQWRIGCGIHSGPVVCGNLGVDERAQFTVTGDTVNVGSRLESLSKSLGASLVVSEATVRQLNRKPDFVGEEDVEIRGRTGLLRVHLAWPYVAEGESNGADAADPANGLHEPGQAGSVHAT